jgi:S-adenosylmethionine/arginine decarboxylase-like enzyme
LKVWGYSTHINLAGCNPERIRSIDDTKKFLVNLTRHIKMTPHSLEVLRFGKDPTICGISGNIFLEESNICLHLVDYDNSAFIDIFSCKPYSAQEAYDYCKEYFHASDGNYSYLTRVT